MQESPNGMAPASQAGSRGFDSRLLLHKKGVFPPPFFLSFSTLLHSPAPFVPFLPFHAFYLSLFSFFLFILFLCRLRGLP